MKRLKRLKLLIFPVIINLIFSNLVQIHPQIVHDGRKEGNVAYDERCGRVYSFLFWEF